MKKLAFACVPLLLAAPAVYAMGQDDPVLGKVMIKQLERRNAIDENPVVLEAQGWVGKDLHKLWIKAEAERADGKTEAAEIQALYSRAIAPFWDVQVGWRHDDRPEPERSWFAIGLQGLAPYFFELDVALFVGESGRTAARLEAEYELPFTQRLILTPEIELNLHSEPDSAVGVGSGLSDLEAGLRLRYEVRREFAPYIGVNWEKKFGDTADFARDADESADDFQFVVGIRAWF